MKGIVIKAKDQTEYKFLSDLLKKLGISSAEMSAEELEDLGLAKMMKSVDRSKKVSRDLVMKKLRH
jgi:reverse gyrase